MFPGGCSCDRDIAPTFYAYHLRGSLLAALRPTHRSFQLEVRFLNSLFSCNVREMSNHMLLMFGIRHHSVCVICSPV